MISQLKILNGTKRTWLLHPASATSNKGVKEIRLLTPKLMIAAKLNDVQVRLS